MHCPPATTTRVGQVRSVHGRLLWYPLLIDTCSGMPAPAACAGPAKLWRTRSLFSNQRVSSSSCRCCSPPAAQWTTKPGQPTSKHSITAVPAHGQSTVLQYWPPLLCVISRAPWCTTVCSSPWLHFMCSQGEDDSGPSATTSRPAHNPCELLCHAVRCGPCNMARAAAVLWCSPLQAQALHRESCFTPHTTAQVQPQ